MLYIGSVKFVDDERFELLPGNGYGDWTLRFRLIRESDAGKYECQISTSPKLSQTFTLNVVGMYFNYRTRAIISRGLYFFYPFFTAAAAYITNNLCTKNGYSSFFKPKIRNL